MTNVFHDLISVAYDIREYKPLLPRFITKRIKDNMHKKVLVSLKEYTTNTSEKKELMYNFCSFFYGYNNGDTFSFNYDNKKYNVSVSRSGRLSYRLGLSVVSGDNTTTIILDTDDCVPSIFNNANSNDSESHAYKMNSNFLMNYDVDEELRSAIFGYGDTIMKSIIKEV